jgi:hypothetical protein
MKDFLRKASLFADLSDDDLERLEQLVEVVQLPAGVTLFAEGSIGDQVYIIHFDPRRDAAGNPAGGRSDRGNVAAG